MGKKRKRKLLHQREKKQKQKEKLLPPMETKAPVRPPGWVSPYASDRTKAKSWADDGDDWDLWMGGYGMVWGMGKVTASEIKEIADDFFGQSYYCIGEQSDTQLPA